MPQKKTQPPQRRTETPAEDPGLPHGWTREQGNKYFDEMYEDNRRAAVRSGSLDLHKPIETLYDPTKPMNARHYAGDRVLADFNAQGVQSNRTLDLRGRSLRLPRRRVKYPSPSKPK